MTEHGASDHLTPELNRRIVETIEANVEKLQAQGVMTKKVRKVGGLVWPLGPDPGIGRDWHGVSNFVDLNPAYPDQVRDYTCGTRSYDTESGYNHAGVDYFIWPFPWHLMDNGSIDVRAAASGTLVAKADGHDDRSCSFDAPDTPNYVAIEHDDGTVALYLHMKRNSVTSLPIGSTINAGQVLGKVGSSGISTAPHLHFELRSDRTMNAHIIETHRGECNDTPSAWTSQRAYFDTRINRLSTHSAIPVEPGCPNPVDQPNLEDDFMPGDSVVFLAAYADLRRNIDTQFRIVRPDGSTFVDWQFDMADNAGAPDHHTGSYWYWRYDLPVDAPEGAWKFEGTLNGRTASHVFHVGDVVATLADPRGLMGSWYEPATSGQGFEFLWLDGDVLLTYFYGHNDDGDNIFLLGTHEGSIAYDETLDVSLYATSGGRYTGLDPDDIVRTEWGQLRLTFESCERAIAELSGADGDQTLVLERLGRTPGLDCDE